MANTKGFPIYFDWIQRLKDIEPDRAFAVICALSEYYQNGEDPIEKFQGAEKALVGIMFDQIKRSEELSVIRSKNGQLGALVTNSRGKSQQISANLSNTTAKVGLYNNNNNNNNIIKEEIYKEENAKETKLSVIDKRFNAFWQAYPKKVAKAAALKWFEKNKPSEDLTNRMIDAIEAQKKSIEWTKDGGEFIPYPSTWLNQGRWEDELTPINNAPKTAENRPQQAKTTTETNIPRFSNYDADDAFKEALKRTYGG